MTKTTKTDDLIREIEEAQADPIAAATRIGLDFRTLPEGLRGGFARWYLFGVKAGSFVQAVIENDLIGAFANADEINQRRMLAIVSWVYNHMPVGTFRKASAQIWHEHRGHYGAALWRRLNELEMAIINMENTDRLGYDGIESLSQTRGEKVRLKAFIDESGMFADMGTANAA